MSPRLLLPTLLLGLALGRPALAQTPATPATPAVPQTGSVSDAGRSISTLPAPSVPSYPNGYTDKHLGGATNATFPNGLPERNIDNGTRRNDQPRAGQAIPGAQPTRSIFKGRKRRESEAQ